MEDLRDKTTFTVELGGTVFRLRRLNAVLLFRILGDKSVGALKAEQMAESGLAPDPTGRDALEVAEKYLRFGMVEPRLGDVSDPGAGVYTLDDLGPYVFPLVEAIKTSGGDAAGFRPSSPSGEG